MKPYRKQPQSNKQLLRILISRGLFVKDVNKALHLLDKIGYFRLSGYFYPQLDIPKENHKFKENSYFDSTFKMYCFDRELRLLLLSNIEKIEVSFRSKLTNTLSLEYDAFWYTHSSLFKNPTINKGGLEAVIKSMNDSREDFVVSFKKNYINDYMPSWMVMEIVTFAHLSKTYENLKNTNIKSRIAADFGVPYPVLENWLLILTYCRNICAHHSRFWNRNFALNARKSKKPLPYPWIEQTGIPRNKSYYYISIIKYLLDRINPNNKLKFKLIKLFEKYPNIDYVKSMEFPENWEEQPLWVTQSRLSLPPH